MKPHTCWRIALFVCTTSLLHCTSLTEKIKERIENKFKQASQAGGIPLLPPEQFNINSVRPARSPVQGGVQVDIVGTGFTEESRVFFGSVQADPERTTFINEYTLRTYAPAYPSPGAVGIEVQNTQGTAVLPNAFQYFEPVRFSSLEPQETEAYIPTVLTLHGAGFIENTSVKISGLAADNVDVLDSTTLRASFNNIPPGRHTVAINNINGFSRLENILYAYEKPVIEHIQPSAIGIGIPSQLTFTGKGFEPESVLKAGETTLDIPAPASTHLWDATWTAQPEFFEEGIYPVQLTTSKGTYTYASGIALINTQNTEPRILSVAPSYVLTEGGQTVRITLVAPNENPEIRFDGIAQNTCAQRTQYVYECTAPAHEEGSVLIEVVTPTHTLSIPLHYIDFQLTGISENEGSVAGGTYIVATGKGFTSNTRFFFRNKPVKDFTWYSSSSVSFRTPSGDLGLSNVSMQDYGITRTYTQLYDYIDPSESAYFTYGGPIVGTIDITVVSSRGTPIQNAYVQLNAKHIPEATHTYGFTDAQGHITFSGPDIEGPQSIHAAKSGFAFFSWIDLNARRVTLMLDPMPPPPPDPLPDCPNNAAEAPPLLRGRVKRIKDAFNLGNDTVIVTTSQANLGQQLPDPGPYNTMRSQGVYELFARSGNMVLIALAGQYNSDQEFVPHAMGFLPYIQTTPGSGKACNTDNDCPHTESCVKIDDSPVCTHVYEDLDIIIDTPLDHVVAVNYDQPPFRTAEESFFTEAPNTTEMHVWYDFGPMGVYTMQQTSAYESKQMFVNMPWQLPEEIGDTPFHVRGGVSFNGSIPLSEVLLYGNRHPIDTVTLTPFLPTQDRMFVYQAPDVSLSAEFALRPQNTPSSTAHTHALYNVRTVQACKQAMPSPQAQLLWYILSHPSGTSFTLPKFPAIAGNINLAPGTYYWQAFSVYNPNTRIENTDIDSLFTWQSSSVNVTVFGLSPGF